MSNGQITQSKQINTITDSNWEIKFIADFNGGNKADIFWRHQTTEQSYIYLMDGVNISARGYSNSVNNDWKVMH